jgi:hypothetical protein
VGNAPRGGDALYVRPQPRWGARHEAGVFRAAPLGDAGGGFARGLAQGEADGGGEQAGDGDDGGEA